MRRHLLIGTFGSQDNTPIPYASDELVTEFPLVLGKNSINFGINRALKDLKLLGIFPSEIGVDLLVLAAHGDIVESGVQPEFEVKS